MTDIAWMFYFADIVSNFRGVVILAIIVFIILSAMAAFAVANSNYDEERNKFLFWVKFSVIGFFISGLLVCILPSRNTIYMAAATVTVDKALESDVGKDVMDIVKFKIKEIKKELLKNED